MSRFEESLESYNEIIKEELAQGDKEDSATEIIEKTAHEIGTPVGAQEWIYNLQKQKQERMQRLREDLNNIDGLEQGQAERLVTYKNDKFFCLDDNGQEVTLGQIITDADWGIKYHLDPNSVPRQAQKRYLIEVARHEINQLYDKQLTIKEAWLRNVPQKHRKSQEAYKDMLKQTQSEVEELPAGVVAERMVRNFFRKITIDSSTDFRIHDADPIQDVVSKTDFVIERPRYYRGVGTELSGKVKSLRVQFSADVENKLRLGNKKEQVRKVRKWLKHKGMQEDIVLVTIPMAHPKELYKKWKENSQPGGPDELWTDGFKRELFKRVMRGMLSEEEIETEWDKISNEPRSRSRI